ARGPALCGLGDAHRPLVVSEVFGFTLGIDGRNPAAALQPAQAFLCGCAGHLVLLRAGLLLVGLLFRFLGLELPLAVGLFLLGWRQRPFFRVLGRGVFRSR